MQLTDRAREPVAVQDVVFGNGGDAGEHFAPSSGQGNSGRAVVGHIAINHETDIAARLTCAPELARRVASQRVALHAGFAHVHTLAKLARVIVGVMLGDARTLLGGVFDFL